MRYDYYSGVGRRAAAQRMPIKHAVQCGTFCSPLPAERMGVLQILLHRRQRLRLCHSFAAARAEFLGHSAVFASDGCILAVQPGDEGVVMAQIELTDRRRDPTTNSCVIEYNSRRHGSEQRAVAGHYTYRARSYHRQVQFVL